jgi:oligopeptide transport system substrate-binding protein
VFPVYYPVRKDVVEANPDTWWHDPKTNITNGAWKMKSFSMDENLVVVPNENYYDKDKLVPASIKFVFLADDNVAYTALRAGEIDISNNPPVEEIEALKKDNMFFLKDYLGTYYVSFNNEKAPFDDPLVRKALGLAIDREYLANTTMQGTYSPATAMISGGFNDADGTDFRKKAGELISSDFKKNCDEARKALADAGYPGGAGFPTVEYMYNESSSHQKVAEVIAKTWEEELGIKTNLAVQEWAVFLNTRREGNYSVARNGWISDWNDPSSMLTIFRAGGGNNDGNYNNTDFDKYMKTADQSSDQKVRMEALHNAEKVLLDDWGCAPVMFYNNLFMADPALKDWYATPLGYTFLHQAHK